MLTPEQERYILAHAYVPEHIVVLMTSLSGGEPFLIDDFFCCYKDDWVILIGYPLKNNFDFEKFEAVLKKVKEKFRAGHISIVSPELPQHLGARCREKDCDNYYTLKTGHPVVISAVKRNLRKAERRLTVERADQMGYAHQLLMQEFLGRVSPPPRIKELFLKMPQYVASACHAFVLNAWDSNQTLTAFYVVDLAARNFANYIVGCYSKKNYVLGASDLLMFELINMSSAYGKDYIHLGLGVNSGIRRFKEKWGARPTLSYQMCELVQKKTLISEFFGALRGLGSR